jgi:hypothetical protein
MAAVSDALSVAKGLTPSFRQLNEWVARISVIWTAWSVLSRFRSVQDVIAFVQEMAREISVNLGWAVDLVVWALWQVAGIFHFITDRLFDWLPFLKWLPDEYRDPTIICALALAPTLIAKLRVMRFDKTSRSYAAPSEEHRKLLWDKFTSQGKSPFGTLHENARKNSAPTSYEHAIQQFWSDVAHENDDNLRALHRLHNMAERTARAFLSQVGFKVFSIRFYLSILLAIALSVETIYAQGSMLALIAVWGAVIFAFTTGLSVRTESIAVERRVGVRAAEALARIHSVYVFERDIGIKEGAPGKPLVAPVNPNTPSPILRMAEHVASTLKIEDELQWITRPDAVLARDEIVAAKLYLWLYGQDARSLEAYARRGLRFPQGYESEDWSQSYYRKDDWYQMLRVTLASRRRVAGDKA